MNWTSISDAYDYWRSRRALLACPDDLEDVETFILSASPATNEDAALMLDVVCANGDDIRCDGLDYAALGRIRSLLSP